MPDRAHVSVLSEVLISTLRLPSAKLDKDLTVKLWKAELDKALALHSTTYFNEARDALPLMQHTWPNDPEIHDLRDLLISW